MSKSTKLKRLALVSAMSVMLLPMNPAGAFEISYDGGDADFYLTGSMENKKAGQIVTLKVTDNQSNILHTRQTYTDANGLYKFSFCLDYNGDAVVTVSEDGTLLQKEVYKSSPAELEAALGRLSGTESIETVITEEADVFQIDVEEYNSLKSSGLFNEYMEGKGINSLADFKDAYSIGSFLVSVQNSDSEGVLNAESTSEVIKSAMASEVGNAYYGLDTASRKEIISSIAGKAYKDETAFVTARDEATIIYMINSEQNNNSKYALIEANSTLLGIDLGVYKDLGLKFAEFKEIFLKGSFTDAADLRSKAQQAYSIVSVANPPASSSGGSSSGGKTTSVSASGSLTGLQTVKPIGEFSDLDGYDWAKTSIFKLTASGVVNGRGEGVFAPQDNVTRAEFVKMLSLAFGISGSADISFDDLGSEHWAYDYVSACVSNGIVNGISAAEFGTSMQITRQDMAVLLSRILDMKNITAEGEGTSFSDSDDIASYAMEGVSELSAIGVINGVGDGRFAPRNFATRAEAAVIINRLLEYCNGR